MAAIDLGRGSVCLIVRRLGDEVGVERLDERAWRFATALLSGQPLGAALDAAQGGDGSALLAEHLLAGRCIAFSVAALETTS